jgi:transcriptional regulator with XRE-family HTH domain
MKVVIDNMHGIGVVVRAARKAQHVRQDDAARRIGVSENFLGKIEKGADTVQWGKLFQVLEGLDVQVVLEVPEELEQLLPIEREKAARKQSKPKDIH